MFKSVGITFGLFALLSVSLVSAEEIKSEFIDGRVFAKLPFNGVEASLLLDTGGRTGIYSEFGWYWKTEGSSIDDDNLIFEKKSPFAHFPKDTIAKNTFRLISGDSGEVMMVRKVLKDGLLGHAWFGTRVWNFDYLQKKLSLIDKVPSGFSQSVPMHFKSKELFYPRIEVTIEGEKLDVLLDSGGTSVLSEVAMKELKSEQAVVASSFIRESVFDQWKEKHSDWKIIEGGDRFGNNPMIRVPSVEIAGFKTGPIWFAKRPNSAYDKMMAELMDCKCAGAVGGNVFRDFDMVLDYPHQKAWFRKAPVSTEKASSNLKDGG